MKKVLLHICCGVCALSAIEKLKKDGYLVEGLFFNPNIYPEAEYILRRKTAQKAASIGQIKMKEAKYDLPLWFNVCGQYRHEPEGGARCNLCYELRLKKTFQAAKREGFDLFTTTLTISPHKNSKAISEVGKKIDPDVFLEVDFKKDGGFAQTMELAKKHDLYRQKYCGCIYSKKVESRE